MDELKALTPWDAYRHFIEDLTFSDFLWLGIALVLMWLFYSLSTKQIERRNVTWKDINKLLVFLGGWAFCVIVFGFPRVQQGGQFALIILGSTCLISFFSVTVFARRSQDWKKIVHGAIVIFVGFSMSITFALGAKSIGYAIIFGFLLGVIIALLIRTFQALHSSTSEEESDSDPSFRDEWNFTKRKK